ncbi:MAG: glutaminyl-peptide cyclotransferase [Smithellaceae bacterium]
MKLIAVNIKFGLLALMLLAALWIPASVSYADSFSRLYSPLLKTRVLITRISVLNQYDHDRQAFTQGFVYHNGHLYESTGLYGKSTLSETQFSSGEVLRRHQLPPEYFAEGIAIFENRIYQLTYQNEMGFIYDLETFKIRGRFSYRGEGWGLTTDGKHLVMSNGSSTLTFHEPDTFKIVRSIQVKDGETHIEQLNEMAFVEGEIWANIFMEDVIVRISPKTGKVTGWIDLSVLYSYLPKNTQVDVLNGIAYDPQAKRIFVTGKFWPKIFEIQLLK